MKSSSTAAHPARMLRAHGLAPRKSWGQCFLVDHRVAARIAVAATTPASGTVVEIGAGMGALTGPLLERAAKVIAVERDEGLAAVLADQLGHAGGLTIRVGDALQQDWSAALAEGPRPHVLAGNLPYVITGRLLQRAIKLATKIDGAVFMVQREVADRLAAAPGSKIYGALSVFAQAAYEVEELLRVPAGAFYPKPQVGSAVVVLRPTRPTRVVETVEFRRVVKLAFASRRKMLRNAWRGLSAWSQQELEEHAAAVGIRLDARAETIAVDAFGRMAERLSRYGACSSSSSSSRKRS